MKKEAIRTLIYGAEYVISALLVLLLTDSIGMDHEWYEYLAMILVFFIPVVVMLAVNLFCKYREEKIRKEVEEKLRNELEAE